MALTLDRGTRGEEAISAFQLAQFGHNYSSMFLPLATTVALTQAPEAAGVVMQFIADAWSPGRSTPPLMTVAWEGEWHRDIADLHAA